MTHYLIRVPAEWLTISDDGACIDADRLSGQDYRAFPIVAEIPDGAVSITVDVQVEARLT